MNTYIVYQHINLFNHKRYIGITIHGDNPNKRWQNGNGYQLNEKFFKDIKQYGWTVGFSHEILATNLSETEARQLEAALIEQYDTVNTGYNQSYGENVHGEAARKKISLALTGRPKTKDSIQKQIITKQEQSGFSCGFDPVYSDNTQRVRCKETGDVFGSLAEAGNWCHSKKISLCCTGKRQHAGIHPETGQQLTWEFVDKTTPITIRALEPYEKKKIYQIQCIETQIIYDNASQASQLTGIAVCNILRVCKGQRKTAGGFHWQFYIKGE